MKHAKKIVVIGGGTGTYAVLSGLKKYPQDIIEPVAVVSMADNGGSTGRLRDEFGYLPVGDVRMALAALAEGNGNTLLRQLFLHRFDKGEGLCGHNFGNLLLVALTDMLGSEKRAIEAAGTILRISGKVLPVTTDNVNLIAKYSDGSIVKGETHIDEPEHDRELAISDIWLEPAANINDNVVSEIMDADLIVLGPGDLYTSVIPNMVVDGMADILKNSAAPLVYVANLMTKSGQTDGFGVKRHVEVLSKYLKCNPDVVLINNETCPDEIVEIYKREKEYPVVDDLENNERYHVLRKSLIRGDMVKKAKGDKLKRSLLRHDPEKLAEALVGMLD